LHQGVEQTLIIVEVEEDLMDFWKSDDSMVTAVQSIT
jgi:hypothetical protein